MSILIISPSIEYSHRESFLGEDILNVLSSVKTGEIDNVYVKELIFQGKIIDLNKSILEQIGEFYVSDMETAKTLSNEILSNIETKENIGIWYGNDLLASKNSSAIENAKEIEVERQIISGIKQGGSVKGFSVRAYLKSSLQKKYFYFGGYVGEGNLSANIDYNGTIRNAEMEITINKDYDVYVNDIFSGHYEKSVSDFQPARYNLSTYLSNFHQGNNRIDLRGENLHVAGVYIKLTYESSVQYEQPTKYQFPGIEGILNLYDGLYVPGRLTDMNIFLHLNSSYNAFFEIGNKTIFNGSTSGEEIRNINNSVLSSLLNYQEMSEKTIPIRFGIENVSYESDSNPLDVFSVTDLSGSMNENAGGGLKKIDIAIDANQAFIEAILNDSRNRVGLVGYKSSAEDKDYHSLSTNKTSLNNTMNNWKLGEGNCVCCGVYKAIDGLVNESSPDKLRTMLIMTDGKAQGKCYTPDSTGSATEDAVRAACEAYQNYNITVHTVGFGSDSDIEMLQRMAACGNGSYSYSDVSQLIDLYVVLAHEMIETSYHEQSLSANEDLMMRLYPDSYIEFVYESNETPYGIITTFERKFENESSGNFSIPGDARLVDASLISYSGSRWTDVAKINKIDFYNLNLYGNDYTRLGDPYVINIPNFLVQNNNSVRVTTGLSPENSSSGSEYNKIIYRLIKNVTSYSPILASAKGCIWNIEFEENTNISVNIPSNYTGTEECYYQENRQEYDENDAAQKAVYNLLKSLDYNLNNKVDNSFTEQDLQIDFTEVTGIPYTWDTEVQVRTWD